MRIKNAFKILLANVSTLYKIVLYRFVCTALFAIIAYFAVLSELEPLFQAAETTALREAFSEIIKGFISGSGINTGALEPAFDAFKLMLARSRDSLMSVGLETLLLAVLLRFFYSYGDYAFLVMTDGFMSSMSKPPFMTAYFSEIGKAALYALVATIITVITDFLIIYASVSIAVYTLSAISVFAIILAASFLVFCFSIRYTLLCGFLPNYRNGGISVFAALKKGLPCRKNFTALLGGYAFLLVLFFYLNASIGLFTLYIGLIVSLPLTSLYFIAVSLVDYYIINGKRYYVDYNTVVSPKEKRENAEMLRYL